MADREKLSPRTSKILGSIATIIAVILLCFAGDQAIKALNKRSEWNKVEATVLRLEPVRGKKGSISYAAWFSFRDPATHSSYVVKSKVNSNPPAYRRGEKVELLYPSDHPEDAIANRLMELFFTTLLLGVIGGVTGLCGLALLKQAKDGNPTIPTQQ